MNEVNEKIAKLREMIEELEAEISDLERENSNWYIGVEIIGDGDYWDEYYYRLGYITEAAAKNWVKNSYDKGVYESRYFAVSKEIHRKHQSWYWLDKLYKSINTCDPIVGDLEGVYEFQEAVRRAIIDIAKEINIEYLGFMHPAG